MPPRPSRPLVRLLRLPVATLPARITTLAVAATVATSLSVTWTSVSSLEAFLGGRVDQKFPLALEQTSERLTRWHAQLHHDLETFARSETLVRGAPGLLGGAAGPRREIEKYLELVLERFAHFEALFLVDVEGRELLRVGTARELPSRTAAQLIAAPSGKLVSLARPGGGLDHIASARVRDVDGAALGTLHAVVHGETLAEMLDTQLLGPGGALVLTLADGTPLYDTAARPQQPDRPAPADQGESDTHSYLDADGERLIGATARVPVTGWILHAEEPYGDSFAPIGRVLRQILTLNLAIAGIFGLIAFRLAASVVRPLRALGEGARRVAEGDSDVRVEVAGTTEEVALLARTFNSMTARLGHQREQIERSAEALRRKNEELELLSITDELTGLNNHRHFQDQLAADVRRADRHGHELSLLLIDIDDFKKLNDTHGHAAGDDVLRAVAQEIRDAMREGDLPARYGGEEFAILVDAGTRGATSLAERLRMAIGEIRVERVGNSGSSEIGTTVSIGVAAYRGDRVDMFHRADRALYRAKHAGKNCVEVDPDGA